ncbi:MAG: tyrosine-type recombinase/integrase [Bacteroidia bacterium]|nr:tyrosine-type recombinase/integrase [Bacteroidia bacterium]
MLEEFLKHLQTLRGASPHTIAAYRRDLLSWARFCQTFHGFDPLDAPSEWRKATPLQLRAWLSLYEKGTTRARKVAAIRRMDKYIRHVLQEKGLSWSLRSPRHPSALPKALSESQLLPVFRQIEDLPREFSVLRDQLVLELLYGCGLRRSELTTLRLSQLYEQEIHILGKGNKWRVLPLYPRLQRLLKEYLAQRANLQPAHDFLLCTDKGAPLYPMAVYRIVRRYLQTHPHVLRHSFATHLLKNGANVQVVRDLLGHESLATTQKYLALSPSELKAAYKKYHPRA